MLVWATLAGNAIAAPPPASPETHQEMRQVMGTLATVRVWAADEALARTAADSAFAVFNAVEELMSTWREDSALSRLNRAPAGTWVPVGREVCTVLTAAISVSRQTGGAFDPTVLPLVRLWGFRGGRPAVPDSAALAVALNLVTVRAVEVAGERVRLLVNGMALDLGGIAKGYALDQAAAAMKRAGADGGVLDLGGNLLVFGDGPGHEVGIVDPGQPDAVALTIPLPGGAVATSGQYERYITVDGKAYGHILDPRTGRPAPAGISATVLAPQAITADALATAVVVMGAEAGLAMLEKLPEVEGVVITRDGIRLTSGLARPAGSR